MEVKQYFSQQRIRNVYEWIAQQMKTHIEAAILQELLYSSAYIAYSLQTPAPPTLSLLVPPPLWQKLILHCNLKFN